MPQANLTRGNSITEGREEFIEQQTLEVNNLFDDDMHYYKFYYCAEGTPFEERFTPNITMQSFDYTVNNV